MKMQKGSPLLKNVAWNFLSQVWFLVLPLAASPYIVRHLGVDAFGVISLASAVIGYLAILDLGMGTATIKYIADYYAERDFQSISKVIGTSIVIYTGLGLLGTLIILATANVIVTRLLHVPVNLVSATLFVFYLSSLGFLVNMPLTVFNAIPNALQRFDILVKQNLALGTATIAGQVVLLAMGYSLKALISLNVSISAIGILVFVIVSRRLLPGVSFRPKFDVPTAKRVLHFSSMKVISIISGHVVFQLDKLLVAAFLPLASVTYYVVSLSLAQKMLTVIPNVTTAVFPAVSEFRADRERLNDLYLRVSKAVLLLVLPMAVALIVFAEKVLAFWMGPEFALHGAGALRLMAMAFLLASFAAVPDVFAGALGKPSIPAFFSAVGAALNLGLALLLIPRYGISGPALALLAGGIVVTPLFIHRVNRKLLGIRSLALLWASYAKPCLAAGLLWLFFTLSASWAKNLVQLGGLVMVGSGLYVLFCLSFGVLDAVEKQMIVSHLRGIIQGRPKGAS
jgi:O-antigen/teichoic acid export membrane protein